MFGLSAQDVAGIINPVITELRKSISTITEKVDSSAREQGTLNRAVMAANTKIVELTDAVNRISQTKDDTIYSAVRNLSEQFVEITKQVEALKKAKANDLQQAKNTEETLMRANAAVDLADKLTRKYDQQEKSHLELLRSVGKIVTQQNEKIAELLGRMDDSVTKFMRVFEDQSLAQGQMLLILKDLSKNFVSAITVEEEESAKAPKRKKRS